ncbi:hypothetical protein JOB18_002004 [Solea senegalensis]|uniref:Uncharacterized protein n=1 Tax=Solea senegalensis TaxID=28829 RepID=A0AAV6PRW0_SOLSE|nr:hypothetical protein JOB18_002004 [Solea senegalensis]
MGGRSRDVECSGTEWPMDDKARGSALISPSNKSPALTCHLRRTQHQQQHHHSHQVTMETADRHTSRVRDGERKRDNEGERERKGGHERQAARMAGMETFTDGSTDHCTTTPQPGERLIGRRREIDEHTELIMRKSIKRRGIYGVYKAEQAARSGRGEERRADLWTPLLSSPLSRAAAAQLADRTSQTQH